MKSPLFGMMLAGAAAMYGCTTTPQQTASADKAAGADQNAAASGGAAATAGSGSAAAKNGFVKVFYFPYDSDKITAEDRARLAANADFLARNPKVKVRVEGNADERGTREYNLALGDRRARAVVRMLTTKGVNAKNLKPVSNGKERPVATCHEESCWQQNRRVELVISGT